MTDVMDLDFGSVTKEPPWEDTPLVLSGGAAEHEKWIQPPAKRQVILLSARQFTTDAGGVYARPAPVAEDEELEGELAIWDQLSLDTLWDFESSVDPDA
jgi:hypothetical protein